MASFWTTLLGPPIPPMGGEYRRYILLDAAQIAQFSKVFGKLGSEVVGSVTLFGSPLAPERYNATPHLFEVAGKKHFGQFARKLAKADAGTGALSYLVSPLALSELASRLKRRLDARLPDEVDCVNRYFDGRITPHLHACLSNAQRTAFFSVAEQWLVVGADHKWQPLPCHFAEDDPFSGPLIFTTQQEAYLIDHCYPYALIEHFEQTDADLLDTVPLEERYGFFLDATQVAAKFGITGASDVMLFCTLCMTRGAKFHEEAPWPEKLASVGRGETPLQQVLKSMHD